MSATSDEAERIPLFPLQSVVLFPEVRVPLHLFEPRYRQMMRDALASSKRIGMAVVQPQSAAEMSGNPPLFDVGCAGSIESWEALPDGRYKLILLGRQRFRIRRELTRDADRLYRTAEIEILLEPREPGARQIGDKRRGELLELLQRLIARNAPDRTRELDESRLVAIEDVALVNGLCQSLELEVIEKQALLEANGVSNRCAQLIEMLRFRVEATSPAGGSGSNTIH
jgi:Lon protease-like protein